MWKRPEFTEIKMDAEIGSYQEDRDPSDDPLFSRDRLAGVNRAAGAQLLSRETREPAG